MTRLVGHRRSSLFPRFASVTVEPRPYRGDLVQLFAPLQLPLDKFGCTVTDRVMLRFVIFRVHHHRIHPSPHALDVSGGGSEFVVHWRPRVDPKDLHPFIGRLVE